MKKFSHTDKKGRANMVDVGSKPDQLRMASACGFIYLKPATIELIRNNNLQKGDVLVLAEIAGIQGGKQTSSLIPLCHPLLITKMEVRTLLCDTGVEVTSLARCTGKTGIEMEALTAVSIALLAIYDMCKAVDKEMVIGNIRLLKKTKTMPV
jgi:cyclic pyranopterin monophosphate synthase